MNENHTFNPICRALIIGASGGIGSALPKAINTAYGITDIGKISRSDDGLDITKEDSIKDIIKNLDGEFEFIIGTTGALEINGVVTEKTS